MHALLATGDFTVSPNLLLLLSPILTLAFFAVLIVWLGRWLSRSPRSRSTDASDPPPADRTAAG